MEVLRANFDLETAVARTAKVGYFFADDALVDDTREKLQDEIDRLTLVVGDHLTTPINKDKPNEIRQPHERYYVEYGSEQTPIANMVINGLTNMVHSFKKFPQLNGWQPTEIGYQRYRHKNDFIGPHRDRSSDKLLSATFTIVGSAIVRIYEPLGDPSDYSTIRQTDEFLTSSGGLMLLRAPGLGSGEQIIHQVLPPIEANRSILNLRMRPTILSQPGAS